MSIDRPLRLYRPSNGTEGHMFHANWCCKCAKDKAMSEGKDFDECDDNEKCQIIADTFAFDVTDPKYPREWRYNPITDVPECTAFVQAGTELPPPRCTKTKDMFES